MTETFTCQGCGAKFQSKQVGRQWLDCRYCGRELSARQRPHFTLATKVPTHMTAEFDRTRGANMARLKEYQNTPEFRADMMSGKKAHVSKGDFDD